MRSRTPIAKRDLLARWSARLGFTRLLSALPSRRRLIVLNYHRIGDASATLFDPAVFSATREDFDWQVSTLQKRYAVVGPDEALEFLEGKHRGAGACIWLTFDDGYLDNYELAYPVLAARRATATFFLISGSVGSSEAQWWDKIAFWVRHGRRRFTMEWPLRTEIDLDRDGVEASFGRVIRLFKSPENDDADRFFEELRQACRPENPPPIGRIYLDWDEAREMQRGGMSLGSHTHSHPVLSKLSFEEQLGELRRAKKILDSRLDVETTTLAYPLGAKFAFNDDSRRAAREAGYRLATSFYGGFNEPGATDLFDVRRNSIDHTTDRRRFAFQLAAGAATGRYWL